MSSRFTMVALLGAVLSSAHLGAQDTTLAGWTFSQFLGEGAPSVSGETFETTDFIVATYRGSFVPDSNLVDGAIVGVNSGPGYTDASIGTWSFGGFDYNNAVDVRADTFGALNTQNSITADGSEMFRSDQQGMMLTFNRTGILWDIQVQGTAGYANAAGADFSYAARGNGGVAVVEWLFNGAVFATQTIAAGSFNVFTHELDPAFYGNGLIQGRLISGSVSFDNVQVNGQLGTPPQFDDQPDALVRLVGQAATFSVAVSGAISPTYQWFKGTSPISGATSASYTIDSVSLADAGDYRVSVRSGNGLTANSDFASLEVRQAPSVSQPPAAQVANPGQNVSFTVVATGTPAPAYRWQRGETDLFDGGDISGATTATLTLAGVTEDDEGAYRVVVSNAAGSVTTAAASLIVSDAAVAPSVSTAPVDSFGTEGESVELTVVASGAPAPTYRWRFEGVDLVDGEGVSGAATDRLILGNLSAARSGTYTVVITNSAGSIEREAELVVRLPPRVLSGPGPETRFVAAGSSVTFAVVATGDPAPAYQWLLNGEPISGEMSDTLTLDSVTAANEGVYSVRLSNAARTIVSSGSELRVGADALITAQPRPALAAIGGGVTFSVTATGNPAPAYQWLLDGVEIPDATERILALSDLTAADAGVYTVRVSNLFSTELSEPAELRVAQVINAGRPGQTRTFFPGSTLVIGVSTTGNSALRFDWFRDGKRIAGANGATLSLPNAAFGDGGVYSVKIYNSKGRLLATQVVARLDISVAGGYDLLLRDSSTGEPNGVVRLDVARTGAFTGKLQRPDGNTYSFRGSFAFPEQPYLGVGAAAIARKGAATLSLALELDAKLGALGATLTEGDSALGSASGVRRQTAIVAWAGRYGLTLQPKAPVPEGQPTSPALLKAVVGSKGGLSLTGRLADGARVTYSAPSSVAAGYAILILPYGKKVKGHVAGGLRLESSSEGYFADEDSSGAWAWERVAVGASLAIALPLSPALAP